MLFTCVRAGLFKTPRYDNTETISEFFHVRNLLPVCTYLLDMSMRVPGRMQLKNKDVYSPYSRLNRRMVLVSTSTYHHTNRAADQ